MENYVATIVKKLGSNTGHDYNFSLEILKCVEFVQ